MSASKSDTLRYTKAKPTEKGYYWRKHKEAWYKPEVVQLFKIADTLYLGNTPLGITLWQDYEWAGPLPEANEEESNSKGETR